MTTLPLAAAGLGIINSPTHYLGIINLPHTLASDKMNRTLRVSLFQTHRNSRENSFNHSLRT